MNFRKYILHFFLLLLPACSMYSTADDYAMHKNWNSLRPWIEPQDTTAALFAPDTYAWQLFVALNWPADTNECKSNPAATFGADGFTTWETWRSREDTFLENAQRPKTWAASCAEARFYTLPAGDFSTTVDEEVRLNKSHYKYIRDNKLYSLNQQERLAAAGTRDLEFPLGAKSVKAYWVKITEAQKPRYHWHEVVRNGRKIIYGLSAFHISSKDNPTWFWATFEHIDNEQIWPGVYPQAFLTWVDVPSVDRAACPPTNLACNNIPTGFGLEGTKWENYRLRGTQTNWVDNRGNPIVLTNSVIEYPFDQKTMSCVTCHAIGVKAATGNSMPILPFQLIFNNHGRPLGYIGALNPTLFNDANGQPIPYLGLDYVWTLRNAKREAP